MMEVIPYNLHQMKIAGRKRIKDRGIIWKENYHEKSKALKKRFDKHIGPGSYYRWEGHDFTTNSDYYVVVGPTIQRSMGKCFFAGIKKMPLDKTKKVYSPSGEYFNNILAALSHAATKWGIKIPQGQVRYDKSHLAPVSISEHIKG